MVIDKDLLFMNIGDFFISIAEECKRLTREVMASRKGWNDKVQKNTLVGSDIYNDIQTETDLESFVSILVHNYIDYIEGGMSPGHWVSERYLIPWMARKGIPTENKIVRAIQASIFRYGITPRPIFEVSPYGEWKSSVDGHNGLVLDLIDEHWDSWANTLFDIITKQLDDFFND